MEKTAEQQAPRDLLGRLVNDPRRSREEIKHVFATEKVWDTKEVTQDFEILAFHAPFVVVRRKSDSQEGTLIFQHQPRLYFLFEPAK